MINTMAAAATRRIAESVNRSAGQHLRAMREHAEAYASKQPPAPVTIAQAAIETVAPTARELVYAVAERYSTTPATAAEWLANAADEIANFEE